MKIFKTLLFLSLWGYSSLPGCDKHNRILHENKQSKEIKFLHLVYTTPKDEYGDTGCNHIYAIDVLSRATLLSGTDNMMNDFLNDSILLSSLSTTKQYFDSNLSKCDTIDSHISVDDVSEEIAFINQDIITTKKSFYFYGAGAAHGNYKGIYVVYNRKTGMRLEWDELFSDTSIEKYILDRVMGELADKGYLVFVSGNSDASTMINAIGVNTKSAVMNFKKTGYFGIVKEGLIIQYNPYEIASFAAGSPSLVIKKDMLKPYMSKAIYEMCFGENLLTLE